MGAYSLDLRQRIVAACDQGALSFEEIAEEFRVSRAFVYRLLQRRGQGCDLAPRSWPRGPAPLLDERSREQIRELVDQRPDATLKQLCLLLQAQGGPCVSVPTLWRALQPLDRPLKKSRCTPASRTRRG